MPKQYKNQPGSRVGIWKGIVSAALLSALVAVVLATGAATSSIRGDRWLADVKYLASDDLKGRGSGTPELNQAATYIADQFKKTGLEPVRGSYFQPFQVTVGA